MLIEEVQKEHNIKNKRHSNIRDFMEDERRFKKSYKQKVIERMKRIKNKGDADPMTDKSIELKGYETPDYNEPKGQAYKKAMNDIEHKVRKKIEIRNNSSKQIKELNKALIAAKNNVLMAEDGHERQEHINKRNHIEEQLNEVEDYSSFDINEYARKLIDTDRIKTLRREALEEYRNKKQVADTYMDELKERYHKAKKEYDEFVADYKSQSSTRESQVIYNRYK